MRPKDEEEAANLQAALQLQQAEAGLWGVRTAGAIAADEASKKYGTWAGAKTPVQNNANPAFRKKGAGEDGLDSDSDFFYSEGESDEGDSDDEDGYGAGSKHANSTASAGMMWRADDPKARAKNDDKYPRVPEDDVLCDDMELRAYDDMYNKSFVGSGKGMTKPNGEAYKTND